MHSKGVKGSKQKVGEVVTSVKRVVESKGKRIGTNKEIPEYKAEKIASSLVIDRTTVCSMARDVFWTWKGARKEAP